MERSTGACDISSGGPGLGQHRGRGGSKFARKFNCTRLVYAEPHATILDAITREKAVKEWPRLWKLRLIQQHDPEWRDLFDDLNA